MTLPLDLFFSTLQKKHSKEEAMLSMRSMLLTRKLRLKVVVEDHVEQDFEELWKLILYEKLLRKIAG